MPKNDFAGGLRRPAYGTVESIGRRDFLLRTAAMAAGAGRAPPGALAAAGAEVETVDITPRLVDAAKREGSVTVRYSTPVDEMTEMARGFQARFGIKVQMDRKDGVLGTQQFATEEHAGQHVIDINYSADPAGIRDLAEEGLYLRYTLADLAKKLDRGAYIPGLGYSPKWADVIISYNPDHIPHAQAKEQFKSWRDLPDPKLKGVPEGRAAVPKLKQTTWWRPYPDHIRWVPDMDDWEANYEKLMPDMRSVLGWKR